MGFKFTIYCHAHIESGRRPIGITKHTMMHHLSGRPGLEAI